MIRFPERSHASVTPDASSVGVEPNYRESRRADARDMDRGHEHRGQRIKHFDFARLLAVLGR